jgi:anti-sigma factor RsiW
MAENAETSGQGEHADFEALAAGYALHALEPEDEQRLSAHLMTCPACARIVADTASLGAAFAELLDSEPPPPGLRERILAAATAEPRPPREPVREPLSPTQPAPRVVAPDRVAPSPARPVPSRRRLLRERTAIAALAAAIGVAVAVPVTLAASHHSSVASTALEQLLLAPNSRQMTLKSTSGSQLATAVVADRGVYLLADGLAANDRSKSVYVLWAATAQGPPKAVATFDVHSSAPVQLTAAKLPYSAGQIQQMAVSLETGRKAPAHPTDVVLSTATA